MSKKMSGATSWATAKAEIAQNKWLENRERHESLRVGEELFLRDQTSYASVLGSAVALRLFLFVVPANIAIAALVSMLKLSGYFSRHLQQSAITGSVATAVSGRDFWSAFVLFLTSLWFTLWTGRSLARVLGTSAALAWRLHARAGKVKPVRVLMLSGVVFSLILISSLLSALRDSGGVGTAMVGLTGSIAVGAVAWFFALLTLPSGTNDPGAQLPGAALVGVFMAILLWLVHVYLPNKIARASDRLGPAAATVSTLGFFFFFGRLLTSSFVLNAVIYERYGSLSQVVFGLPGLRAIPKKWPRVATFFALDGAPKAESHDDDGDYGEVSDGDRLVAAFTATDLVERSDVASEADAAPSEEAAAPGAGPVAEQ
jgi:hypothetical protein